MHYLHNLHKRSIFHFANYWLDYLGCHLAVKNVWDFSPNGNPMQTFSLLIVRTRSKIIRWRVSGLNSLDLDLNKVEHDITSFEMTDCSNIMDHTTLFDLHARYAAI